MIDREKISIKISEICKKNRLEETFQPILEEFFYRAADQYEWDDYDLNIAISKLEKVSKIRFENLWKKEGLFTEKKECSAYVKTNFMNNKMSIVFDVDELKGILKFDKNMIETFTNNVMHELGHVIQSKMQDGYSYGRKEDKYYTGFEEKVVNSEDHKFIYAKGTIANEYAEILNASRLQYGYIPMYNLNGYEKIQNAGKIMLYCLGISDMEFSSLQTKRRKPYEELISSRLGGVPSKIYIDSFEELLDSIYNFAYDKKQRKNLISQIDALQTLSKNIFDERFEDITQNSDNSLINLARLIIEKEGKDNALMMIFDEFDIKPSELEMDEGIDIYEKLLEKGYGDDFIQKLYDVEIEERLKIQEQIDKQEKKEYNNDELNEKIYQSFLRYSIKDIPLKDRYEVILSKIKGYIKRKNTNKDIKFLLDEGKKDSSDSRKKFIFRIANLSEYNMQENHNMINKGKVREDNTNENNR